MKTQLSCLLPLLAAACSSSGITKTTDGGSVTDWAQRPDPGSGAGSNDAASSGPSDASASKPDPSFISGGYHVGPGQPYTAIGDVPWYKLQPGDTVYIHYRAEPYRERFLISGRGTPSQWIRVLGVPGPAGELPVISGDGATTSTNSHYHWQNPTDFQNLGVIQIAIHEEGPIPGYIEVAKLQVQDGRTTQKFTAENGQTAPYDGFAACIYAKSPQHLLIHDCVLTNCGQGFYNWTGDGQTTKPPSGQWWDGLAMDITLRQNYFYNNGNPNRYTEHQSYTEALGVVIEGNHYGKMQANALGNQIKDRSAGTVIRYNYIESANAAWHLDLVEPEESAPTTTKSPLYGQDYVYGNVLMTNPLPPEWDDFIHWNEDHYVGTDGRAIAADHRLFLYHNTIMVKADLGDATLFHLVNSNYGGWDCAPAALNGHVDLRNNIIALQPRTAKSAAPTLELGYCKENFDLSHNWISPGWTRSKAGTVAGADTTTSPSDNNIGFADLSSGNLRLAAASSATGLGDALAPQVVTNNAGQDYTPVYQYHLPHSLPTPTWDNRPNSGKAADLGAFQH